MGGDTEMLTLDHGPDRVARTGGAARSAGIPVRRRVNDLVRDCRVSPREAEVLAAMAEQCTNTDLASLLHLSVRTVESHVSALMTKLGTRDRGQLIQWGRALVGEKAPMSAALAFPDAADRPFVGREAELDRLWQLWETAKDGTFRTVFVGGEPGAGKTRLAAEFAREARADAGLVLVGRCAEDLGVPYQPLLEVLREYTEGHLASAAQSPEEALGRYAGELVRLVPELREMLPGLAPPLRSDPQTEQYRLFDAVAAALVAISAATPTLVVLEDLQWATRPTLLLVRHVIRCAEPMRILLLGTFRNTELLADHPLVEVLARPDDAGGRAQMELGGLAAREVAELASAALGGEPAVSAELIRTLHSATDGNPLYVCELLRHLAESSIDGANPTESGVRASLGIVPDGISEVVRGRLRRLSSESIQLLELASVAGRETNLALLRQMWGDRGVETLVSAVEEACSARLISELPGPPTRYRFSHDLVRATVYQRLSSARRELLHRIVGEAIEVVHGDEDEQLPVLAHHFALSASWEAGTKPVTYVTRAGDRAMELLAHEEAVSHYGQALDLLRGARQPIDEGRRCDILISLGEAQKNSGREYRATLLAAANLALGLGDRDRLTRAALANHRGFWSTTLDFDADRARILEAALAADDGRDSPTRARLLANLASERVFPGDDVESLTFSDEAVGMARRLGDRHVLGSVLLARFSTIWHADSVHERWAITGELLDLDDGGDPLDRSLAFLWREITATELGQPKDADLALQQSEAIVAEFRQPALGWLSTCFRSARACRSGNLPEAERLAWRARELGLSAGQPDARLFYGALRFNIRFEQGRLSEILDHWTAAVEMRNRPLERAALAVAYCELGRPDDARTTLEPLASLLPHLPKDFAWLPTFAMSAFVCSHLGDTVLAEDLYHTLLPYSGLCVYTGVYWIGSVAYYLAGLARTTGRIEAAGAYASEAQATHELMGAAAWAARSRMETAHIYLTRGDPGDAQRARRLVEEVVHDGRRLGLPAVVRQGQCLLEQIDSAPSPGSALDGACRAGHTVSADTDQGGGT